MAAGRGTGAATSLTRAANTGNTVGVLGAMGPGKAIAIRELDPAMLSAGMMSGGALGGGPLTGVTGGMSRASGTLDKAADPFAGNKTKLYNPALNPDASSGMKGAEDLSKTQ